MLGIAIQSLGRCQSIDVAPAFMYACVSVAKSPVPAPHVPWLPPFVAELVSHQVKVFDPSRIDPSLVLFSQMRPVALSRTIDQDVEIVYHNTVHRDPFFGVVRVIIK